VTTKQIAIAMKRAESVLKRRPGAAITADPPAMANWEGGMRVVMRNEGGPSLSTDMPEELGGSGDRVTPGWLLRAGLASCLTTRIAMAAAALARAASRPSGYERWSTTATRILPSLAHRRRRGLPDRHRFQPCVPA
jgi:hypothetical protein